MNRWARLGILAISIVIFGWVGLGHVLAALRTIKPISRWLSIAKSLQKIQQDYVDEPNMGLVEAGSLHGLLESLDSESSYLTPSRIYRVQTKGFFIGDW